MAEIEAKYAPDWVLIGDLVTDESLNVVSGKVLFHSPIRDDVHRMAGTLRPGRHTVLYLGTYPEDFSLNL